MQSRDIERTLMKLGNDMSVMASQQEHTSENIEKLSNEVSKLVEYMHKDTQSKKDFSEVYRDVTKNKEMIIKVDNHCEMNTYRTDKLEKIVYGTVSILLTSIIGSIAYAFVGVKQ
jgi:hypothetical protein